jgi:hypothetical protein
MENKMLFLNIFSINIKPLQFKSAYLLSILLLLISALGLSGKALAVTKNIYCVNPNNSSDWFWVANPTRAEIQGRMVRYRLHGVIHNALLVSLDSYNQAKLACGDQHQPQPGNKIELNWYGFLVKDSEEYFLAPAITSNSPITSNIQVAPELWIERRLPHTRFNSSSHFRKASFGELLGRSEFYMIIYTIDNTQSID